MLLEQDDSFISKQIRETQIGSYLYFEVMDMANFARANGDTIGAHIVALDATDQEIDGELFGHLAHTHGWEYWVTITPSGTSNAEAVFADSIIPFTEDTNRDGDIIDLPLEYHPLGVININTPENQAFLKAKDSLTLDQKMNMFFLRLTNQPTLRTSRHYRKRHQEFLEREYQRKEKFYENFIRAVA